MHIHSLEASGPDQAPGRTLVPRTTVVPRVSLSRVSLKEIPGVLTGKGVPSLPLRQAWRTESEPAFSPATVRMGWANDSLIISAEMDDLDILNSARQMNERVWLYGDTLEIFLKDSATEHYVEYHVTPRNVRVQLLIPGEGLAGSAIFLPDPEIISSMAWIDRNASKWFVNAEIPSSAVGFKPVSLLGRRWRFSICRYDYSRRNPVPILSSTSPLKAPAFHRLDEWLELEFC